MTRPPQPIAPDGQSASDSDRLRAALKKSASALKADAVPFALAGSYALWVHGAPESTHDVDLVVEEGTVEQAVHSLTAAGFRVERPPEDWLFKAYLDDAMVDVLHRLNGVPVSAGWLDRAEPAEVLGLRIPVLGPTDVIATKLKALSERYCDFGQLLPPVRAVREQLDWPRIRAETVDNPFAAAFLVLAERLGIIDEESGDRTGEMRGGVSGAVGGTTGGDTEPAAKPSA